MGAQASALAAAHGVSVEVVEKLHLSGTRFNASDLTAISRSYEPIDEALAAALRSGAVTISKAAINDVLRHTSWDTDGAFLFQMAAKKRRQVVEVLAADPRIDLRVAWTMDGERRYPYSYSEVEKFTLAHYAVVSGCPTLAEALVAAGGE